MHNEFSFFLHFLPFVNTFSEALNSKFESKWPGLEKWFPTAFLTLVRIEVLCSEFFL